MAGQLGQSRQGRGTAEFQNHQKTLFQGLASSKCWFWNCSKPGHGGAEQAGQGHSRVPKPKRFFKAWEAQNAGFGTAQSQGMAGQLGQSRQGRGTAEFQNYQKNFFKAWEAQNAGFGTAQSLMGFTYG